MHKVQKGDTPLFLKKEYYGIYFSRGAEIESRMKIYYINLIIITFNMMWIKSGILLQLFPFYHIQLLAYVDLLTLSEGFQCY